MNTAKLELAALVIAILVVAASATSPSWLPRGTTLRISPSGYAVESGASLAFTASLESGGTSISSAAIRWSVTDGSLDRTSGPNVMFTAPVVSGSESVTVAASFTGEGVYQPSKATAELTVSPARAEVTTLKVIPAMFEVHSGDTLTLNASLSPSNAPSQLISWSVSPSGEGSLSSMMGASVTYTAPAVQTNTSVIVTASFLGNSQYVASNDSSQGSIVAPQVVLKTPTVVVVSPSKFSLQWNRSQVITASLEDTSGNVLVGKTVAWSISPSGVGSLSSTTGTSMTYTAPAVDENTTVTIRASFAGDESYLGSSDESAASIAPIFAPSDLYLMTFDSAALTNITFQGPIVVDGMSVTNVTCDVANLSGFSLSHLELNSSSLVMSDVELYATRFKAYSPDSGNAIEITGGQNVSLGPMESASYMNGSMYVVRISATTANLTRMEAVGERADGSEPYIPSILGARTAVLSDVSNITGPVSYGDLAVRVSNITTGTVDIAQFSLEHPIMYSLNMSTRAYSSTGRWLMVASGAIGSNVSVYSIYFKAMVHGAYSITATGNDDISKMIPHALYSGCSFYVANLEAHAVYFSADELTLNDFMLSIE